MRMLSVSLILVILVATLGVGWLVDRAYTYYHHEQQIFAIDKLKLVEEFTISVGKTLNSIPNEANFLETWTAQNNEYQLSLNDASLLALPESMVDTLTQGEIVLLESTEYLSFHYFISNKNKVMTLRVPISKIDSTEKPINYIFTGIFYIAIVLTMLLWSYPLIARLLKVRKITLAFGKGDLSQRIKPSKLSYVSDIEKEFNRMADRIASLVSDVKLLSGAVSHDLRTPLSRIQLGLDTLSETDDLTERRQYEKKIYKNILEMELLIDTLLHYARLDQSRIDLKIVNCEINTLVSECIDSMQFEHIKLDVKKSDTDLLVCADKQYLSMAIKNVLDNAHKYGQGEISVSVNKQGGFAQVMIGDNGSGIEASLREEMLKPFVRGKHENHHNGHGFGLAIVKRIVDWHHGSIDISESKLLSGAAISICIPLANQQAN